MTDNGVPNLSHQETITVTVAEVNVAPVLANVPATASIPELVAYTFDANATDADLPAQTLAFGLSGAPTGAAIDPSTGVFTWTPTEAQGPGSFTFDVTVGDGVTTSQQSVTLTVTEVNVAPVLGAIGNKNALRRHRAHVHGDGDGRGSPGQHPHLLADRRAGRCDDQRVDRRLQLDARRGRRRHAPSFKVTSPTTGRALSLMKRTITVTVRRDEARAGA